MPTASALVFDPDVPLMTEQAPSASADAVSHSAADASATVSANSTVPIMSEGDLSSWCCHSSSGESSQWLFLIEFIYLLKLNDI